MDLMKKKVLVTSTHFDKHGGQARHLLEKNGWHVQANPYERAFTKEELALHIKNADAVIAGVDVWNESLYKMAPQLKIIARFGSGVDNIDLDKAEQFRILVTHAKGSNAESVAEYTIALLLAASRKIVMHDRFIRNGGWPRTLSSTLFYKTVGLIGYGAVAQHVARLLSAFKTELLVYDPYVTCIAPSSVSVKKTDLQTLLCQSDMISLHVPMTPKTKHMIGAAQLAGMKPHAILVNTARGSVIDQNALYHALKNKTIGGAALDVFEDEPTDENNPLFELDNTVVSPHAAAETIENIRATAWLTAGQIIDAFNGIRPAYCVTNPDLSSFNFTKDHD